MPERVQRKRTKGWKMPPNTVYVGRPTIWGNPFNTNDKKTDVKKYKAAISKFPVHYEQLVSWREAGGLTRNLVIVATSEAMTWLRGKNLACWCALDQPCHADILLRLANEEAREE